MGERVQWGVRYQRRDRDEWTSLITEHPTLREAKEHARRLDASPDRWRRVRIIRRTAVSPWRLV